MNEFEKALIEYLDHEDPAILDRYITSPTLLLDTNLISEDNILKDEATLILDCLNSYNKGIDVRELDEELLEIDDNSPLYSWRSGVLAIREFYREDHSKVAEYLNTIRDNSPVKKLNNFLLKESKTALFSENRNLNSSVDALKEVIDNSLTELYPECVKMLIRDLSGVSEYNRDDIILTIIEESLGHIPLETIHTTLLSELPPSNATRLMALGTIFKHPLKGLCYLFSYFSLEEYKDPKDSNLLALLTIISDLTKTLISDKYRYKDGEERESFIKDSRLFIDRVNSIIPLDFKESENPLTNLRRALDLKKSRVIVEPDSLKLRQSELF